jgi:hypothetical protein
MNPVYVWVPAFVRGHVKRHDCADRFPKEGSDDERDLHIDWLRCFQQQTVSEKEAIAASRLLVRDPPGPRHEHLPAILREIARARGETAKKDDPVHMSREAALAASASCPYCRESTPQSRGERVPTGWKTVFHPLYNGSGTLSPEDDPIVKEGKPSRIKRTIAARVNLTCVCPMGHWVLARQPPDELGRKVWTLHDVLEGRLNWKDPHISHYKP